MKRLFFSLVLLLHFSCDAQNGLEGPVILTKDSLQEDVLMTFRVAKHLHFHNGDSAIYADVGFDDRSWPLKKVFTNNLTESARNSDDPASIVWYRLHINIDTSLAGTPLLVHIIGKGAYEIYLDGKKMEEYGHISGKFSKYICRVFKPGLVISIKSPGEHLLAVRHAAYAREGLFRSSGTKKQDFWLTIGDANRVTQLLYRATLTLATSLSFVMGIFLVLGVIHILLFLYYSSIRSNLYFSIYSFAIAYLALLCYLGIFNEQPGFVFLTPEVGLPFSLAIGYFSFSGINNELFSRRKIRFYIICGACFVCCLVYLFSSEWGGWLLAITGFGIFLEALILPVSAIIRKVKGARIVGAGILFSVAFVICSIIYVVVSAFASANKDVNANNIIFSALGICSVFSVPFSMSVYLSWSFANTNRELKKNLRQVQLLSAQTLEQEREKKQILENQNEKLEQEVTLRTEKIEKQHEELKKEKKKSDDLLLNILPEEVAEELKQKGHSDARHFDDVTVLFTDFVDFTIAGETMTPRELVNELNVCFRAFDEIISHHDIEKIKTIGDAYMAVCGLPAPQTGHATKTIAAAQEIIQFMTQRKQDLQHKTFDVRIGIHSGNVVAGIVGVKKFAYDIWGDTVNTAARMEQNSAAGKINISQTTYELVKDQFGCTYRGEIAAKGKGNLKMYFVE